MRCAWLAALMLLACSASPAETIGESTEAIVGGLPSTADQDFAVLVIGYHADGTKAYLCTGTLVAPNLVLTARHCVSNLESEGGILCAEDGTLIDGPLFTTDTPAAQIGIFTGVSAVMNESGSASPDARGLQVIHGAGSIVCNSDLGFIVLDRALTTPIAPLRMTPPAVGEALTVVGYGLVGNSGLSFVRQQRSQTVLAVGPTPLNAAPGAGLGSSELLVGEGVCSGDSGGPVVSAKGELAGVASRGGGGMQNDNEIASNCIGATATSVFTDLVSASALVDQALAAAKAAPQIKAPTPTPTATATTPPTPAGTPAHGDDSGGCTTSFRRPTGGGFALVALAAALVALRRRR